jgi:hypothetical protein
MIVCVHGVGGVFTVVHRETEFSFSFGFGVDVGSLFAFVGVVLSMLFLNHVGSPHDCFLVIAQLEFSLAISLSSCIISLTTYFPFVLFTGCLGWEVTSCRSLLYPVSDSAQTACSIAHWLDLMRSCVNMRLVFFLLFRSR